MRTDHPFRDSVCVQCVLPDADSGSSGWIVQCLSRDAAIGEAMLQIAHLAEIVDDGKRDDSGLVVAIDMTFGIGGADRLGRPGRGASGAGNVDFVALRQGRTGRFSVAADRSSRTGSGDGQIIGQ